MPLRINRQYLGYVSQFQNNNGMKAIVVHWTAGNNNNDIASVLYTLNARDDNKNGTADELGYHYIITQDGTVWQLAEPDKIVQHASPYSGTTIGISLTGGKAPCRTCEGVEDSTPQQQAAAVELIRSLMARFNIPATNVVGHSELEGVSKGKLEGKKIVGLIRPGGLPAGLSNQLRGKPFSYSTRIRSKWYAENPGQPSGDGFTWRRSAPSTMPNPTNAPSAEPSPAASAPTPAASAPTPAASDGRQQLDTSYEKYFTDTYTNPIRELNYPVVSEALRKGELTPGGTGAADLKSVIRNTGLFDPLQLDGELALFSSLDAVQTDIERDVATIASRVDELLPSERAFVILFDMFEFYPDVMRNKMLANGELSSDYTHAWRAPGKLAITANMTIPGISGFRMGQVFFIGRTYEHYKKFGVFQLFGFNEKIDINKGWTTSLYARYNAIPMHKLVNLKPV